LITVKAAPLVVVAVEKVVHPHAGVEQVARFYSAWDVIDVERRAGDVN